MPQVTMVGEIDHQGDEIEQRIKGKKKKIHSQQVGK